MSPNWIRRFAPLLYLVVAVGCGSGVGDRDGGGTSAASARVNCAHFELAPQPPL